MPKIKLGELEQSIQVLTNILYYRDNNNQPLKLPFSISYRLTSLLEKLDKEIKYFLFQKQKLAEAYAERDEDGNITWSTRETDPLPLLSKQIKSMNLKLPSVSFARLKASWSCPLFPVYLTCCLKKTLKLTFQASCCFGSFLCLTIMKRSELYELKYRSYEPILYL